MMVLVLAAAPPFLACAAASLATAGLVPAEP